MSHRLARRLPRLLIAGGLTVAALALVSAPARGADTPVIGSLPNVKHVWTIILENSDEAKTLAEDTAEGNGELTTTLRAQGAYLPMYFATGHSSLDNYVALASAQGPTTQTQGDCTGVPNADGSLPVIGEDTQHATFNADGQALGTAADIASGHDMCTYPADVPTLGMQLQNAGYTWETYAQDMDSSPSTLRTTCQAGNFAKLTNSTAPDSSFANDYARKHDPELYFYGITGLGAAPKPSCDASEVGLGHLLPDLASESTTPDYSLIVPDLCNDAHDSTCQANSPNPTNTGAATTSGIPEADKFLEAYVPAILASPAYKDGGLLMITFDEGSEALACCGEVTSPNLPAGTDNGGTSTLPSSAPAEASYDRGGGQIGMVAISPFILPGTVSPISYNHYSYVRTMENLFRLTPSRTGIAGSDGLGHIGYAGSQGGSTANAPAAFGSDVFTNALLTQATPALPDSRLAVLLPIAGLLLGAGLITRRMKRTA